MRNVVIGARMSHISHLSRANPWRGDPWRGDHSRKDTEATQAMLEPVPLAEDVPGSDPNEAVTGLLIQIPTLDVVKPLFALDAMPIAFVLERYASIRKQQVGMQNHTTAVNRYRRIHMRFGQTMVNQLEPKQRFRSRIGAESNALQYPRSILCATLSPVSSRSVPQLIERDQRGTSPRADEEVSRCDEVTSADRLRQLAPHICRGTHGEDPSP